MFRYFIFYQANFGSAAKPNTAKPGGPSPTHVPTNMGTMGMKVGPGQGPSPANIRPTGMGLGMGTQARPATPGTSAAPQGSVQWGTSPNTTPQHTATTSKWSLICTG